MAEYDPQRSRPRRRVADEAGPAPVDELLDATPEPTAPTPANSLGSSTTSSRARSSAPTGEGSSSDAARHTPSTTEVVDLSPVPPAPSAGPPGRARLLFVLAVIALALVGFVLRRVGASRRARRP
jgi:hypothetical protein